MARLGLVNVQDAMLGTQRKLMAFRKLGQFCIPRNYHAIWSQLQEMPAQKYSIPDL